MHLYQSERSWEWNRRNCFISNMASHFFDDIWCDGDITCISPRWNSNGINILLRCYSKAKSRENICYFFFRYFFSDFLSQHIMRDSDDCRLLCLDNDTLFSFFGILYEILEKFFITRLSKMWKSMIDSFFKTERTICTDAKSLRSFPHRNSIKRSRFNIDSFCRISCT